MSVTALSSAARRGSVRARSQLHSCIAIWPILDGGSYEGLHTSGTDSAGHPARSWLRGMPENGGQLGPSTPVLGVRPRWLLRLVEEQTRDEALSSQRAPDHEVV